jgi:hypothetical protein
MSEVKFMNSWKLMSLYGSEIQRHKTSVKEFKELLQPNFDFKDSDCVNDLMVLGNLNQPILKDNEEERCEDDSQVKGIFPHIVLLRCLD